MSKHDIQKMRQKLKEKSSSRIKDPNNFIPPVIESGAPSKQFRFFILPPFQLGETCADGTFSRSMELYYVPNGMHWVNKRPYTCPRIHDEQPCAMCDLAFGYMEETKDKAKRSQIAKLYLPQQRHAVNIYFLNDPTNPEDLRGKVMWFNAPKAVLDLWDTCINRDDQGDPADPQAFGLFYDEEASYIFQLEVGHKGGYNNYEKSKFLSSLGRMPIVKGKDSSGAIVPHTQRITEILAKRHDLFTKFQPADGAAIEALVNNIVNQSNDNGGFDDDETVVQTQKNQQVQQKTPQTEVAQSPRNQTVSTNRVQQQSTQPQRQNVVVEDADLTENQHVSTAPVTTAPADDPELESLLSEINNAG